MMARGEFDIAAGGQFRRLLLIPGQALVDQRAHHRAPLRATHPLPGDGWAGVEDQPVVVARDDLAGDPHPY